MDQTQILTRRNILVGGAGLAASTLMIPEALAMPNKQIQCPQHCCPIKVSVNLPLNSFALFEHDNFNNNMSRKGMVETFSLAKLGLGFHQIESGNLSRWHNKPSSAIWNLQPNVVVVLTQHKDASHGISFTMFGKWGIDKLDRVKMNDETSGIGVYYTG